MHAFLIVGKTQKDRNEKTKELLTQYGQTENPVLEPGNLTHTIKSIRDLAKSLNLKSPKFRAIVVNEAERLSPDAGNAFLKTLEEPPKDTIIILTAPNQDSVLETIASRCMIINLGATELNLDREEKEKHEELLEKLIKGSVGERFRFAETIEDREKALLFITGQIYATRKALLDRINESQVTSHESLLALIECLIQTKTDLEQNINVKLTLTDLMLNYR